MLCCATSRVPIWSTKLWGTPWELPFSLRYVCSLGWNGCFSVSTEKPDHWGGWFDCLKESANVSDRWCWIPSQWGLPTIFNISMDDLDFWGWTTGCKGLLSIVPCDWIVIFLESTDKPDTWGSGAAFCKLIDEPDCRPRISWFAFKVELIWDCLLFLSSFVKVL